MLILLMTVSIATINCQYLVACVFLTVNNLFTTILGNIFPTVIVARPRIDLNSEIIRAILHEHSKSYRERTAVVVPWENVRLTSGTLEPDGLDLLELPHPFAVAQRWQG